MGYIQVCIYSLLIILSIAAEGKITLVASASLEESLLSSPSFERLFIIRVEDTEKSVMKTFSSQRGKVAIIREDLLRELYRNSNNNPPYYILGKLNIRSVLCYASHEDHNSTYDPFLHKKISIGLLGDMSSVYFKNFIAKKYSVQMVSMKSLDAYRSLVRFKKHEIDGMFLFATDRFARKFSTLLSSYSEDLKNNLSKQLLMHCPAKERFCYYNYYVVAHSNVGKGVLSNIYNSLKPLLDDTEKLSHSLGRYYVPLNIKKYQHEASKSRYILKSSTEVDAYKNIKSPKFHRAPWMDIAIREAIVGKGSPENRFPMLDLSYKYIRFAKGKKGITTAPNDNREGSWCAAYISWSLDRAGYRVHKSGRMASQSFRYFSGKLYRKIDKPIFGAITLYTKTSNPTHGHVGYLFGKTPNGRLLILGGNQNNRLKFSSYGYRFGSYKLNGFYIPMNYEVENKDYLSNRDIYPSAKFLNRKYGIQGGRNGNSVR